MAMLKTANLFRYSQIHSKYVKLTLHKYRNNNAFTSLQKIANFMQSFYVAFLFNNYKSIAER